MPKQTFSIAANLKIKHGRLARAVAKLGGQSALARHLGVSAGEVGRWCNLQRCPPDSPVGEWTKERLSDVEGKLFELTGSTFDDLFPPELRARCRKKHSPVAYSKEIEIERDALLEMGENQIRRLTAPAPVEALEKLELEGILPKIIESQLNTLSYREREIIKLRFGLGDGRSYTLEEVGRIFKVNRERIRQIEAKAVRKLQQPSRSAKLLGMLDLSEEVRSR